MKRCGNLFYTSLYAVSHMNPRIISWPGAPPRSAPGPVGKSQIKNAFMNLHRGGAVYGVERTNKNLAACKLLIPKSHTAEQARWSQVFANSYLRTEDRPRPLKK